MATYVVKLKFNLRSEQRKAAQFLFTEAIIPTATIDGTLKFKYKCGSEKIKALLAVLLDNYEAIEVKVKRKWW